MIELATLSLLIAGMVVALGLAQVWLGRSGRALAEDWMAAAETAGLADASTTNVSGSRFLEATCGPLRIRMTPEGKGTRVAVDGLPGGFRVALQGEGSFVDRVLSRPDVETGDVGFDRSLVVQAVPLRALALLDAETRAALSDLAEGRGVFGRTESRLLSLGDGRLVARCFHGDPGPRVARLAEILRALLELCGRLAETGADEDRIARNLAREPDAAVRLRGLRLLAGERPQHAATARAAQALLADPDDAVRMTAALASGEAGEGALRAMEPSLLAALAHADAAVRDTAARALGRVGGVAVVPALREAEPALGRVAREAVASIQSRLVGADQGQLALAQADGAVSLADVASGRLELRQPEEDGGRVEEG